MPASAGRTWAGPDSSPGKRPQAREVLEAHRALLAQRLRDLKRLTHEPVLRLDGAEPWLCTLDEIADLATQAVRAAGAAKVHRQDDGTLATLVRLVSERISAVHSEVRAAAMARRALYGYLHTLQWFRRLGVIVPRELTETASLILECAQHSDRAYVFIPRRHLPDLAVASHAVNMAQVAAQTCLRLPGCIELDRWAVLSGLYASLRLAEEMPADHENDAGANFRRPGPRSELPDPVRQAIAEFTGQSPKKGRLSNLGQILVASDLVLAELYQAGYQPGPVLDQVQLEISQKLYRQARKLRIDPSLGSCAATVPLWVLLVEPLEGPPDTPQGARASAA